MEGHIERTIRVNGQLMDLSTPKVMGILNVTPDSFYAGSRKETTSDIVNRVEQIIIPCRRGLHVCGRIRCSSHQ